MFMICRPDPQQRPPSTDARGAPDPRAPSCSMAVMAKTAAQRRAARKRKEQDRDRWRAERPGATRQADPPRTEQFWASQNRELRVRRLIAEAGQARHEDAAVGLAVELARLDPDVDSEGHVTQLLMNLLSLLWEHGWQPADVAHVARRTGRPRLARLVAPPSPARRRSPAPGTALPRSGSRSSMGSRPRPIRPLSWCRRGR
jgi:hypothetical protein